LDTPAFRRLVETVRDVTEPHTLIDEVFVLPLKEATTTVRLEEGKWIKTTTCNTIRIDHPTHGVGQTHAHIYGRKGDEIGVINLDGTASHGSRMRLKEPDAELLRAHGFSVRPDRVVEWIVTTDVTRELLLS
jgi:hypothetical protein